MTPKAPTVGFPPPQTVPTIIQPSSACIARATKLITEGRKIEAIKEIRTETNMNLYEAKEIVDRIAALLKVASPKPQEQVQVQPSVSHTAKSLPPSPLEKVSTSGMHYLAPTIIKRMRQGLYPFLYGAPGAGKTTLMQIIAKEAELDFLLIPGSLDMLRSEILGTLNPIAQPGQPRFNPAHFFEIWANGGIVLFDECGNAAGSFLNILNAALANVEIRFPDGSRITKHPHCYLVFADNSTLHGDDERYPERQDAGGAFRNRLYYMEFKYDTELERKIVADICPGPRGEAWINFVHEIRPIVERAELPIAASPRFAYAGAKILAYEERLTLDIMRDICNGALYEGLRPSVIEQVKKDVERVMSNYARY